MAQPIEFYFDFSSPYGYLAGERIDAMAARNGRTVVWKPFLLGAVFKVAGTAPLVNYPLKGDYSKHDFLRSARLHKVPFKMPERFPTGSIGAVRGHYLLNEIAPGKESTFDRAVYRAYFVDNRDISDNAVVADVAASVGIDKAAFLSGIERPDIKDIVRKETETAIARGVFGSPFIFIDGEPFWGSDRLEMAEQWLKSGGW
jgi:2-hydroxychromene-2-carboxylate isomerase